MMREVSEQEVEPFATIGATEDGKLFIRLDTGEELRVSVPKNEWVYLEDWHFYSARHEELHELQARLVYSVEEKSDPL